MNVSKEASTRITGGIGGSLSKFTSRTAGHSASKSHFMLFQALQEDDIDAFSQPKLCARVTKSGFFKCEMPLGHYNMFADTASSFVYSPQQ